jgi:hypothetical protein
MTILQFDLEFDDHVLELRRAQDSQVNQEVFEQFAGIYLEHMRKQMQTSLPATLAIKMQQGLHTALLDNQKNNQVKDSPIHINKNIVDFCATQTAFVIFIRGNFYITSAVDLILSEQ